MSVSKFADPTGHYNQLGLMDVCKVAAGYVPAFINADFDMMGQLGASHLIDSYQTATFNEKDLTLTMDITGVTMLPLALVVGTTEKVYVYNHGMVVWFNLIGKPSIYLVTPKEETMRLSVESL